MTLDQLIADLIAARAANPEMGDRPVIVEDRAAGVTDLAFCSAVRSDGNGPVDPEGSEAHQIYLATHK